MCVYILPSILVSQLAFMSCNMYLPCERCVSHHQGMPHAHNCIVLIRLSTLLLHTLTLTHSHAHDIRSNCRDTYHAWFALYLHIIQLNSSAVCHRQNSRHKDPNLLKHIEILCCFNCIINMKYSPDIACKILWVNMENKTIYYWYNLINGLTATS